MKSDTYVDLSNALEEVKVLTMEFKNAKQMIESIGQYCGHGCCWDSKTDLDLKFNVGYFYKPNFSETSCFDAKMSSDLLNNEIKKIILKNIEDIAKEALGNIEKQLTNNQSIVDKLIGELKWNGLVANAVM